MTVEMGFTTCAPDDLPAALADLPKGDTLYAWLEDPYLLVDPVGLRLRDDVGQAEVPELVALWPSGRVFHAAIDLRWERRPDGQIHLVAVGERLPARFQTPQPLTLAPAPRPDGGAGTEHLLLWGQRPSADGDVWGEGRIPGLKEFYPDWGGQYAAIESRTYEAPWHYDPDMPPAVRVVTRYLRYIGDYPAPLDRRLTTGVQ